MDRLISEQAVIESIEFFQMNPQHFDFVNLIDDIKEIPSAEPKIDVLDKIRAEIEKKIVKKPWFDFEDRERDRNDAFLEVLDIIDKYKAEMQ